MSSNEQKLETALKQLDYIAGSEYILNLDIYNIDSSVNKLCDWLVDLMIAQDKYDIYESRNAEFVDKLLRDWVGYDQLEHAEVINEFLSKSFLESTEDFLDCITLLIKTGYWLQGKYNDSDLCLLESDIENLVKAGYWSKGEYNESTLYLLVNDTVDHFAELTNNLYQLALTN